jgi:hypothetical protein
MAVTGPHWVPVYSPCADTASPSALNGVVHTNDHRPVGHKAIDHNAQQLFGDSAGAPAGAVEDLMIACEVGGLSPAGHAQAGSDGPLAGCQQGTHHQNEHMLPTGGTETRAPRLQPLAQYQGTGSPITVLSGSSILCFESRLTRVATLRLLSCGELNRIRFDPKAARSRDKRRRDCIADRSVRRSQCGGVGWYEDKGAYHFYPLETEAPIARLKPAGTSDDVRLGYWSHRRRWEDIDDMGGCVLPLDQALDHIANNSIFWTWT